MLLLTIVEAYVNAALERAVVENLEDGTVGAYIPDCPGILAFGSDVHECAVEMYRLLEDWVKVNLARGIRLPIIGGIDLNSDQNRTLATYNPTEIEAARREFYEDAAQLEAAFDQRRHHPLTVAQGSS